MNGALAVREEICEIIHNMPERGLYALRPLLDVLVDVPDDDDVLSSEELDAFTLCKKNIKDHPESFTDWKDVKKEMGR